MELAGAWVLTSFFATLGRRALKHHLQEPFHSATPSTWCSAFIWPAHHPSTAHLLLHALLDTSTPMYNVLQAASSVGESYHELQKYFQNTSNAHA